MKTVLNWKPMRVEPKTYGYYLALYQRDSWGDHAAIWIEAWYHETNEWFVKEELSYNKSRQLNRGERLVCWAEIPDMNGIEKIVRKMKQPTRTSGERSEG